MDPRLRKRIYKLGGLAAAALIPPLLHLLVIYSWTTRDEFDTKIPATAVVDSSSGQSLDYTIFEDKPRRD